jgi:predicted Rossmann-fold nucleotide-binding protein
MERLMLELVEPGVFQYWLKRAARQRPVIAANMETLEIGQMRPWSCRLHRDNTYYRFAPYDAGFIVSTDGTLHNLFSVEKGCGDGLMEEAVAAGARKLECYDVGVLLNLYRKHGFKETNRVKNWQGPAYPDVVYMVRR